ncbi:arginine N-succinyltransferase [Marinobacter sp. BGYM27]|uniref:arginine N-succinyltransferase n=1 Tax=unclassified Marinobacter TaxID=83889 RepID=UPI0021A349C1|nr:arginine N-succinyltransferase [Marinobacter sp. BGYM27]MDG5498426.1 arginine N-succinyltransferase [Marinobacter sp. BGYM27]
MFIRPIAHKDLDVLQEIAVESGPGFTSLVDDRDFLTQKIQHSIDSFASSVTQPCSESYLFVLEDPDTGDVIGTTGIEASVGMDSPLYHYHKSQVVHHSRELSLFKRVDVLNMCNHYTGCTEICTLFLRPQFRRAYAGKLLSKVRFLFMAQHPQRFANTVIAEMRGVSCDDGRSPFWTWLRDHFVDLDFATVTGLVGSGNNRFIAELMPKYPLYTHLLSPEAQQVIGQVHDKTRPALHMLESEGFRHKGYVDLFDAGPTVEAELSQIRSIAGSIECRVQVIDAETPIFNRGQKQDQHEVLAIANTATADFRATVTEEATYLPQHNLLQIPSALCESLGLTDGATARFVQLAAAKSATATETQTYELKTAHRHQQEFLYAL